MNRMPAELPPPSDVRHTYVRRGFGVTTVLGDARPSEMRAWKAKSWWWRLRHRKEAPWLT